MDPCPFVRLTVGNLALKIPVASRPDRSVVHPSSSPCFCVIRLKSFAPQNAVVPFIPTTGNDKFPDVSSQTHAATFNLSKSDLDRFARKSSLFSTSNKPCLKISVYSGHRRVGCGFNSGGLLGRISVPLDLTTAESRSVVFHNGWIKVGKETKSAQFHLNVKAEPDPRFVFRFDGDPECSPQIFQIRGNIRQPVFTCKFSLRTVDRNQRSRSFPPEYGGGGSRNWLSSFGSERERLGKERKGWSITIHDLSGSPVAAASMVTPFVASPGSDRVSRSSPGCWLILRHGSGTWKLWGRLEAWREGGAADGLGYRFELIPDSAGAAGIVLAESTLSCSRGGKFIIDFTANGGGAPTPAAVSGRATPGSCAASPVCSPRSSGDFSAGLWPYFMYRGFVMSASIGGESRRGRETPAVEVSVQHVSCTEDAAAFVALSAAIDLSLDACRLFSHKLRKELCQPQDLPS